MIKLHSNDPGSDQTCLSLRFGGVEMKILAEAKLIQVRLIRKWL